MTASGAIVAVVLVYTWILAPITPRSTATLASALVLAIAVWRATSRREWGLAPRALRGSLILSTAITLAFAIALIAAGVRLRSWHLRDASPLEVAALLAWTLGQQFALQIVLLRDAQRVTSRTMGVFIAGALFAALHLPNPFLSSITFAAALAWCWIYDRYPNLLPLAVSHAVLTVVVLSAFDDAITGRLRIGVAYLDLH